MATQAPAYNAQHEPWHAWDGTEYVVSDTYADGAALPGANRDGQHGAHPLAPMDGAQGPSYDHGLYAYDHGAWPTHDAHPDDHGAWQASAAGAGDPALGAALEEHAHYAHEYTGTNDVPWDGLAVVSQAPRLDAEAPWHGADAQVLPARRDSVLSVWDLSDAASDDTLSDDFDAYKDFYNMGAKDALAMAAPAPRPLGAVPPLAEREVSAPLVQVGTPSDVHPYMLDGGRYESRGKRSVRQRGPYIDASVSQLDLGEMAPLGPEYTSEERHRMTREFRRWHWRNQYLGKLDSWLRGYNKIGGWLDPRYAMVITFITVVWYVAALTQPCGAGVLCGAACARYVAISHSRVAQHAAAARAGRRARGHESGRIPPRLQVRGARARAHPSMNGTLHLRFDNTGGWVPSHVQAFAAEVRYTPENTVVGHARLPSMWIPGRKVTSKDVLVEFTHTSLNVTGDATQLAFQDACAHICT